jgi:hypothetical protein
MFTMLHLNYCNIELCGGIMEDTKHYLIFYQPICAVTYQNFRNISVSALNGNVQWGPTFLKDY